MAPPCISRSFRCSSWPLLGHQAEVNSAEPAATAGYHDGGQPAHDRRRISFFKRNRRGYCCTNARVERSLVSGRVGWPGCERRAQGLDPVAVVVNQTSVPPESLVVTSPRTAPSVPPDTVSAPPLRQLLYTVSRQPHCLPVPPDSSSTLSPDWYVTLLLPVLLASARFCTGLGGVGNDWGKQVGSMGEESQVRGCCNITFICTNQETV